MSIFIEPLGPYVIVEPDLELPLNPKNNIVFLGNDDNVKPIAGKIRYAGCIIKEANDPKKYAVGDTVAFNQSSAIEIKINGKDYLIVPIDDIYFRWSLM